MLEFLGDALFAFLASVLGDVIGRPLRRRRQRQGKAYALLRVVSGTQDGVSTRWRGANLRVSSKSIAFGTTAAPVIAVGRRPKNATFREQLMTDWSSMAVFALDTPTGRLELAIRESQADWLVDRLGLG